jgi:hypothetical protein
MEFLLPVVAPTIVALQTTRKSFEHRFDNILQTNGFKHSDELDSELAIYAE